MKMFPTIKKIKKALSKSGSLLLLFQRTPAAQILLPEVNLLTSAAAIDTTKLVIATVIGLGAYDSVAGATTVSQVSPSSGATVPVTSGANLTGVFQIVGGGGHTPQSWSISSGALPSGLTLANSKSKTTTLTGSTTQTGTHTVTIRAWENASFSGRSAQGSFTIQVSAPPPAAVVTQPPSPTIIRGNTTTLTVTASGSNPLTYQWFQGTSGTTTTPVGTNSASFTTPALESTTSYWVKVTNAQNSIGADSNTATVTVLQPATITTHPAPTNVESGQSVTLSVVATGDAPLTYQWYQGASGVTTTPVGTNSASFTTPALISTTSYWVKVTNIANSAGAISTAATVTTVPPATPSIFYPSPLATGLLGVNYSTDLSVVGGVGPYTWTLFSGALPAGLTLSSTGVLSGIPTETGTSSFTIQVEDDNGLTDTQAYSLTMSDLTISTTTLPTAVKNVDFSYSLSGQGGSTPYTWALSSGALPPGITLSSGGVLSGKPTAGGSTFTVQITDDSDFTVEKQLTLMVSASFLAPIIQPIHFMPITIGTDFSYTVSALNYPKTFAITGLPKGLKFVASTGVISGRPDVSGVFNVQVRATNTGGASTMVTAPLTVKALNKNLVGTFGGIIGRDPQVNQNLGGTLTVTTTSNGSYSIKLMSALAVTSTAATSYTAVGRLTGSSSQIEVPIGGRALTLSFDTDNGDIAGFLGSAPINGHRSFWNALTNPAEALQGYYSMALDLANIDDEGVNSIPQGTGFASFNVGLSGSLSIIGKTADGEVITSSGFLGENGEYWLYTPLYKKLGSIQGELNLNTDPEGLFVGNTTDGSLTWFKPTTVTRAYAATFGPIPLKADGGYLAPASKGNVVLGLPDAGSVQMSFTDGGLASSAKDPDMSFTYTDDNKVVLPTDPLNNPGKVAITLVAATGVVTGNFTLVETIPPLTRAKVAYQGQVVRTTQGEVKAVGYFLLPQIPGPNETAATSPILSGGFHLSQTPPAP